MAAALGIGMPPGAEAGTPVAAAVSLLARAAGHPEGANLRLLQQYATALATGLAALVAVLDPEIVVLSGAVTAAGGDVLRELVEAELADLAPPGPASCRARCASGPYCAAHWRAPSPPPATRSSTPRAADRPGPAPVRTTSASTPAGSPGVAGHPRHRTRRRTPWHTSGSSSCRERAPSCPETAV